MGNIHSTAVGTSLDKDKTVDCHSGTETDNGPVLGLSSINSSEERVPSTLLKKNEKISTEVMGNVHSTSLDKDEAVNCDSETETDNGGPHPRWVPSAQANGPRWSPATSSLSSIPILTQYLVFVTSCFHS